MFRRTAGNRIESPCELSGIRVVRCEKSADGILRTGHADKHFALGDAGRPRRLIADLGRTGGAGAVAGGAGGLHEVGARALARGIGFRGQFNFRHRLDARVDFLEIDALRIVPN